MWGKIIIALLVIAAVCTLAAYVVLSQPPSVGRSLPSVRVSSAAAHTFDEKIAQAAEQVRSAPAGTPVSVSLTDAELTSKAVEALRAGALDLPVTLSGLQIHAVEGALVATSQVTYQGFTLRAGVRAHPIVRSGKVQLVVDKIDTGGLPIPEDIAAQIRTQLGQPLDPAALGLPVTLTEVSARGGVLQVSGARR